MERNNWQNRSHPRDWRLNNRRAQQPEYSPPRFNSGGNRSSYAKRAERDIEGQHFKTKFYQRRHMPYDKNRRNRDPQPSTSTQPPTRDPPLITPVEAKALRIIDAVKSQEGVIGQFVLLHIDKESPTVVLQNAIQSVKNAVLTVKPGNTVQSYELRINGELIVEGQFPNKQVAKNGLCELALEKMKSTCFSILKKKNYEEISTEELNKKDVPESSTPSTSSMEGSKAHLMMLKMGWGGKGLGVNEQGAEKTVAETMTRNITKEGLGGTNVMAEINNILEEFARSAKITTLGFDSDFTKDERAHIHNLAAKLNLKSKSEGKGEDRRITIAKKISRWDLVKELLLANGENESYKLIIPSDFEGFWAEDNVHLL